MIKRTTKIVYWKISVKGLYSYFPALLLIDLQPVEQKAFCSPQNFGFVFPGMDLSLKIDSTQDDVFTCLTNLFFHFFG